MSAIEKWSVIEAIFWTFSVGVGLAAGIIIGSDPRQTRARRLERRRKRVSKAIESLYLAERQQ